MNKLYQNRDWLKEQYWNQQKSTSQIGRECNVCHSTILDWIKRFNISRRSNSEAIHLAKANHCQLSQEAIEWIEGELLGDGCLQSESKYSARFAYGSKYMEYIQYISNTLKSFGIEQIGKIYKRWTHGNVTLFPNVFNYASRCYEELKPIYEKWYPNRKKVIPKDIKLTSLLLRQEYIG